MNDCSPRAAGSPLLAISPSSSPAPVPSMLTATASPSTSQASCPALQPIVESRASSRRRSSTAASIVLATASAPMISASTTISSTAFEISSLLAPARTASLGSEIVDTPGSAACSLRLAVAREVAGSSLTAIVVASCGVLPERACASASVVMAPVSSNVIPEL